MSLSHHESFPAHDHLHTLTFSKDRQDGNLSQKAREICRCIGVGVLFFSFSCKNKAGFTTRQSRTVGQGPQCINRAQFINV